MISRYDNITPVEMLPGIIRRTLKEGRSMMICEFTLDKGTEIPIHSHPQEQIGYIVSGKIRITVDSQSFDLGPGDCYGALPEVPHGALVLERAVVVDTFSPLRDDYREINSYFCHKDAMA
jgi:quercetin dioxygenase-like cupin family protein